MTVDTIFTVNELIAALQKKVEQGYGDKPILVEDAQEMYQIHSVQMNTCSGIDPEYLFMMAGHRYEHAE